jgi:hypothetical protein
MARAHEVDEVEFFGRANNFLAGFRREGEVDFEHVVVAGLEGIARELTAIRELMEQGGGESSWEAVVHAVDTRRRSADSVGSVER